MPTLAALMQRGRAVPGSRPWPRAIVGPELWRSAGHQLAEGHWTLLSLWADAEAVVRLEERLGYAHKGIDGLMTGADLARGAKLAGRASGDSTVAYALAFSHAAEAALRIEAPVRAVWLRALMAEMERLANHIG